MGANGLERDQDGGWVFRRPAVGGTAMLGYRAGGAGGLDLRVTALPAVTVLIEFGENELIVDSTAGEQAFSGFVSGFPRGTMRVRTARAECVEVRLSPLLAYSLSGIDPAALGQTVIGLEDLWGRRALSLRERLADAETWDERFALTNSFLRQCAEPARTPDPEVIASWQRIVASRGRVRVDELAGLCGWSRKRLWARFEAQIGLTPKRAAMLVRFRHAVEGLLAGMPAADVAVTCGYTDQSHLCRDVSSFADTTPGSLTAEPLSPVSRHRYQAWGTFFPAEIDSSAAGDDSPGTRPLRGRPVVGSPIRR
ncbi:helix-turn-helix domain-containing protein [Nocardia beijingensis]|uniref:helix-turn-helix domain-containing protein n=1 Tax=Nocardia beijingensis TaxID=95162 RepID=UPI002B4ABCDD|nr:helix-turn-helix domain-containing protein [Nocardia beijingensis]